MWVYINKWNNKLNYLRDLGELKKRHSRGPTRSAINEPTRQDKQQNQTSGGSINYTQLSTFIFFEKKITW